MCSVANIDEAGRSVFLSAVTSNLEGGHHRAYSQRISNLDVVFAQKPLLLGFKATAHR